MKATAKLFLTGFVLLLVCAFGATAMAETKTIVIKGSTTVLPVAQAAAEAYMAEHKDVNISISGGGSGNGIKALIDKSTDIANASRFIKGKEVKMAVEKGSYPVPHRVAIDAIVPIVHPKNPVKDLTIEQLSLIYQGKITNWKDLGGNDKKIVVISRDTSSGTYEVWEELVLHKEKVTNKAQLAASNGAVHQAVSKNSYAIGYVGFGYLNNEVKAININSVIPSMETAISGAYPVARPLFMFTAGWPSGITMDFISFLLSPKGQEVVEKEGFIPLY